MTPVSASEARGYRSYPILRDNAPAANSAASGKPCEHMDAKHPHSTLLWFWKNAEASGCFRMVDWSEEGLELNRPGPVLRARKAGYRPWPRCAPAGRYQRSNQHTRHTMLRLGFLYTGGHACFICDVNRDEMAPISAATADPTSALRSKIVTLAPLATSIFAIS